jgi:serine/threonine protein kinase
MQAKRWREQPRLADYIAVRLAPPHNEVRERRARAALVAAVKPFIDSDVLPETLARDRRTGSGVRARSGFDLGHALAHGGMGIVRVARQRALHRDVVIKSVRPKLACDAATRMLMQEAYVLARLDHPNILPIYDLRYENCEMHVVLKKVDGKEWGALMHQPETLREQLGVEDALAWNLEILMTVCKAIHYAHSRGVIHRDLKPENVMVGQFGEVYVIDWGLAVCLEDDGTDRFPLARDATQLAGTPQYMAPEMLGEGKHPITERTDVYLLGSILYEILAGHAPHVGRDMDVIRDQVLRSRPELPPSCSSELERICRVAMDPDPDARFESVEALRRALLKS